MKRIPRSIIFTSILARFFSPILSTPQAAIAQSEPLSHGILAATAPTAVPPLVPYAGLAVDAQGRPLGSPVSVTFLVYKDESGGEPLFAETQNVAVDATGHYKVQLGASSSNGLPTELFATGEARWIEVQIAGQSPQTRVLIASVPYALKASDAATLGGLPASAFARAGIGSLAAISGAPAVTSAAAADVTTTGGTSGSLPVFNGATTVLDSPVFVLGADVGIGTAAPAATLDVRGTTDLRGGTSVYNESSATTTSASHSYGLDFLTSVYDSSTGAAVKPLFELRAEPTGNDTAAPGATLNLLSSNGIAATAETGFHFNSNGTINFAAGQTFPGGDITGAVNASSYDLAGTLFATGSASAANAYLGFAGNTGSTGTENTGVGYATLTNDTSGYANTAIGEAALSNNTAGIDNTASGRAALFLNSTGGLNTALGEYALYNNTSGGSNTASGYSALFSNTSGSLNSAFGTGADVSSAGLSYATAIGANSVVSQSNTVVLGHTTAGSPGATYNSVGIGTATPRSVLEAVINAPNALGPTLTLTNSGGTTNVSEGAAATSIDFNTYYHPSTAYKNPTARILATDDEHYGNTLAFHTKIDGADSNGLQTTMEIYSNGGVGAFGQPSSTDATDGLLGYGGDGIGSSTVGGDGGAFYGGLAFGSGDGGDGIFATGGNSNSGTTGYAAYFAGTAYASGGFFTPIQVAHVDHPLDPANKYLNHASIESSEMLNIYSGNATTDELGLATVKLPDWFESENGDFRYQLTVVGGRFAQAIVAKEIANHEFTISTNASNVKVSWQITGVRQDGYAKAHPLTVEQVKPERERGYYQNPELFGQLAEKQTEWGRNPQRMQRLKVRHTTAKASSGSNPSSPSAISLTSRLAAESTVQP